MIALTPKESKFIAHRRLLVAIWPLVSIALLAAIGAAWWYLAQTQPLLANPFAALDALTMDRVPRNELVLLAGAAPITVTVLLTMLLSFVIILFGAMLVERRLLKIIKRLMNQTAQTKNNEVTSP